MRLIAFSKVETTLKQAVGLALVCALVCALAPAVIASQNSQKTPEPAARIDQPVAELSLKEIGAPVSSEPVSLSQFRGKKNVVLVFFMEKCSHTPRYCRRVMELVKTQKENGKDDLAVLGIRSHADDKPASFLKTVRSLKLDVPILDDPQGAAARYFHVQVAPTFILIDKEGVMRYFGAFDNDDGHGKATYGNATPLLADALKAVRNDEPVTIKRGLPFGCALRIAEARSR